MASLSSSHRVMIPLFVSKEGKPCNGSGTCYPSLDTSYTNNTPSILSPSLPNTNYPMADEFNVSSGSSHMSLGVGMSMRQSMHCPAPYVRKENQTTNFPGESQYNISGYSQHYANPYSLHSVPNGASYSNVNNQFGTTASNQTYPLSAHCNRAIQPAPHQWPAW